MDIKDILKTVDHTLLLQTSTWDEIKVICDDGMKYGVASVCIPPSFVKRVKEYVGEALKICTVIGFPNGYNTTEVKVFETRDAIQKGADEIDMVINIGMVKEKNYDYITNEIREIKEACEDKILKVIIETCLLTEEEKIVLCDCVTKAGADFIKTSTGFSNGGATIEDIELFKKYVGKDVKIKAAGGVKSIEKAEEFIEKGASRLGTSSIIKIMNNEEVKGY
ncbi:deoxyribose-phosphate aldolase [Clostridium tertium]|jgi:deoxyribose-phosphate aldolase|uniref:deoxyribose-phosphate aldolase n=1 Tax=Clostridium TaxID=1485 RepID=UPI0011587BE4|nr:MULTISPECIES: deoxyribose-phosphate aldolase [Clostridium]MBS5308793.1 deoxyribose-phosphate aldolase [Clostridium sp.]MDB1923786.1 deoxyribose-phosphate aldolase [Clostridium tertium]MDB1926807.1 deoxyribose-phosphate aldolase [Clostridium tertium]MDB1930435.1 deoxyribose-phosphate aldolase [Clostridium tertium]MDB1935034.1 deoxyribose-phosphate aldolase [Clostridium tertium]